MKYLKIQSIGEIEKEAFTLIGASSKRNDQTKIGFFGSGLKYSIAALIRNNRKFHVFKGDKEVLFTTQSVNFRESDYLKILVDGVETSLTTTMGGSDWDIPFAPIREIYSNAMDEDEDAGLSIADSAFGESGTTSFFIEMDSDVKHFYDNRFSYFCTRNPSVLHSNSFGSVYPKDSEGHVRLFRKGILCYHNNKKSSIFTYNSPELEINESRVLSSTYGATIYVACILKKCDDTEVIRQLVEGMEGGNSGQYEHEAQFDTYRQSFSDAWGDYFKSIKCVPAEALMFASEDAVKGRKVLPMSLLKPLNRQFKGLDILGLTEGTDNEYVIVQPNQIMQDKIVDCLSVLNKTRYKHRLQNPDIKVVNFIDENVLGLAENGSILLSSKLDSASEAEISKIIIEENEHNRSGFGDKTRNFQNHLFNLYYDELTK